MKSKQKPTSEFLMTYGWAVMVIGGAIGALYYFEVLNIPLAVGLTGAVVTPEFTGNLKKYWWLIALAVIALSLFLYSKIGKSQESV